MKKLLALVLALVMSMSLVTISNAAFKDADKISNKEAVDVMAAVGVLAGYDNGEFGATDTLTRAQACKIIAYLDLGKDVAEALPALQVFSDLPAGNWAAKYVAYCADAGYVSGVGDNKFAPDEKVTGYQFGKMLLCVLGYDAEYEQFTGPSWEIAVAKKMKLLGLADQINKAGSVALTREEAAQYSLNALETQTVTANKGTTTTVNGVTVVTGGAAATPNACDNTYKYNDVDDSKMQLAEQLYGNDLKLTTNTDDLKRSTRVWTYDSDKVGTYAGSADETIVITKTSGKYAELKFWLTDVNENYYDTLSAGTKSLNKLTGTADFIYVNGTSKTDYAPKVGDVVEVYENSDDSNKIDKIVVYNYKLAKITKVDNNVTTVEAKDDVTAKLTMKDAAGTSLFTNLKNTDIVGFNAATYVKNAYIAYVEVSGKIVDSYVVTAAAEGKVSSFKADETYTVNGTKFSAATTGKFVEDYTEGDFAGTYAVYTDKNGIAIGIVEIEAKSVAADAVYVVKVYNDLDNTNAYGDKVVTTYAQVVDMNGVAKNIVIGKTTTKGEAFGMICTNTATGEVTVYEKSNTGTYYVQKDDGLLEENDADAYGSTMKYAVKTAEAAITGKLYSTSEKSDGYVALTAYTGDSTYKAPAYDATTGTSIKTDATKFSGTYYVDSNTRYIMVSGSGASLEVTVKDGGISYSGANVSSCAVIYSESGTAKVAKYVVIPAAYSAGAESDLVYVKSYDGIVGEGKYAYTVYTADGSTLSIVSKTSSSDVSNKAFYKYSVDNDDIWTLDGSVTGVAITEDVDVWKSDVAAQQGVAVAAEFESVYNELLTLKKVGSSEKKLGDIKAADAVIIDLHETDQDAYSDKATKDTYSGSLTTLDALASAKEAGFTITLDLNITKDGAQIIFVKDASLTRA